VERYYCRGWILLGGPLFSEGREREREREREVGVAIPGGHGEGAKMGCAEMVLPEHRAH
jgi:hypothetical protein